MNPTELRKLIYESFSKDQLKVFNWLALSIGLYLELEAEETIGERKKILDCLKEFEKSDIEQRLERYDKDLDKEKWSKGIIRAALATALGAKMPPVQSFKEEDQIYF